MMIETLDVDVLTSDVETTSVEYGHIDSHNETNKMLDLPIAKVIQIHTAININTNANSNANDINDRPIYNGTPIHLIREQIKQEKYLICKITTFITTTIIIYILFVNLIYSTHS
uniref:Uncharacterized protein n=1 Tax=viral metagenome TaxID=1070528 RepID=A0A6C0ES70_9ZZZZ